MPISEGLSRHTSSAADSASDTPRAPIKIEGQKTEDPVKVVVNDDFLQKPIENLVTKLGYSPDASQERLQKFFGAIRKHFDEYAVVGDQLAFRLNASTKESEAVPPSLYFEKTAEEGLVIKERTIPESALAPKNHPPRKK